MHNTKISIEGYCLRKQGNMIMANLKTQIKTSNMNMRELMFPNFT